MNSETCASSGMLSSAPGNVVDKLAAAVILEQWLASQGRRKEE